MHGRFICFGLLVWACACSNDGGHAPQAYGPASTSPPAGAAVSGGVGGVGGVGGSSGAGGTGGAAALGVGGSAGSSSAGSGAAGGTSGAAGTGGTGGMLDAGSGSGGGGASDAGARDSGADAVDSGPPVPAGPVTFGSNVRINDDAGNAQQTEVVIAARPDGLILAGFIDVRTGSARCGYSVSSDGGKTWGKNFFASSLSGGSGAFAGDPAVAIDDAGTLYAACQDYGSTTQIMFSSSSDSGASWSSWKAVNQSPDKPWLGAARDGTVFLSWLGNPGGFKRSTDGGKTWGDAIPLGNLVHGTGISVGDTGIVHVAYNLGNYVRYSRSTDWGATLEPARNLVLQGMACFEPCSPRSHPIVGNASDPTGRVVAVTWASTRGGSEGDGDDDVWVMVSQDSGETFSDPIRVNDNTSPSRQFQPWVAVDRNGWVHVVWTDMRDGGSNATYYARMTSLAEGFEPNVKVSETEGAASGFLGDYKGVAIQGDDVVVAWCDTRNDAGDIYFARAAGAAAGKK